MSTSQPSVTAVICSRDGGELLPVALAHLREALGPRDDVLVIDSASKTTAVMDAAREHGFNCVRVDEPGLSKARNAAVRHARGDVIAFTDDDCRPDPDWIERIRGHFANPQLAFVTGRVRASREVGTRASVLEGERPARYEGIQDPHGIGHGANMAFRRSVVQELGGFDESLGAGAELRAGEDVDMIHRCLANGWEGFYEPDAVITHEQWRSRRELLRLRYGYGLGNGAFRAKAARQNFRPGLQLLFASLWRQGLAPTLRALLPWRLRALPGTAVWTAGMLVGLARGFTRRLDNNNFATRRRPAGVRAQPAHGRQRTPSTTSPSAAATEPSPTAAEPPTPPTADESQLDANEVRSRATRGVLSVGARNILVRALGLAGTVVLTRLLTPHQFGLLAFGFAVKSVSDVVASGGLAAGLIRRKEPPSRHELEAAQGAQLVTTCALTSVIVLLGVTLGGVSAIAAVMALSLPIYAIRVPTMVMLERNLNWSLPARTEVTETLVYNVVAIALVAAGGGPFGAAWAVPAQGLTGTLLLLWRGPLGLVRPRFSWSEAAPLLKFGVQFQSVTLISSLRDQGLNIVVGAAAGITTVGIWTVAYKVLQPIGLVLQSLWRVSYPASARILEAGADPRRLTERALRLTSVVVGVPAVLIAGTAPDLVVSVFGQRWAPAAQALPWGAAALMFMGPVSTFPVGFLGARGDVRSVVGIVGAQTVAWLALAAALAPVLGVKGVGIAMLAGALTQAVAIARAMRRHADARAVMPMLPAASAAFVAGALGWLTAELVHPPIVGLIVSGVVALGAYVLGLLIVRRSDLVRLLHMAADLMPARARSLVPSP